jgi:hypothetical protein
VRMDYRGGFTSHGKLSSFEIERLA